VQPVVVSQPVAVPQPIAVSDVPSEPPAQMESAVVEETLQFTFTQPTVEPAESSSLNSGDEPESQFNFAESTAPRRSSKSAPKDAKAGGLKSLLSVFSRKPGSTAAKSKAVSTDSPAAQVTPEPSIEQKSSPPTSDQPQFSFGIAESDVEAPATESSEPPAADDDFQKFLQQF
jgi:hypothetical protein